MSNALSVSGNAVGILADINIPESQKLICQSAAAQIINVTSRAGAVDDEIKAVKARIAANADVQALKELKRARKELGRIHQEAVANFNGSMKVALADVPGNTLNEKYRNLGA